VAARLGVALGVGFIVGLEREIEGKDAGVRTHMLLALGAAVFGVVSVGGFSDFIAPRNDTNINIDVTRVASYVAAGIGFLGGGTIIKSKNRVHGLTTAASLWVVAGAGLAAGVGLYEAALLGGVLAALVLVSDRPISWITGRLRPAVEATEADDRVGSDAQAATGADRSEDGADPDGASDQSADPSDDDT
jgi:putative Mg2+ transporter-C (MgtC) family protein